MQPLNRKRGNQILSTAAKHNRRANAAEVRASPNINSARSHFNETLAGPETADGVAALANQMMKAAGVMPRKDAVLAIELVFSLPKDHQIDDRAFFIDCTKWAGSRFGGEANVLSSDIHRDEKHPHCHVLVLPLLNGKLSASKLLGNREQIAATQQNFFEAVASNHGLTKPTARLSGDAKRAGAQAVLKRLREVSDGAIGSLVWGALRDAIEQNPEPFILELGIDFADVKAFATATKVEKPSRTFAQIMTGKGRSTAEDKNPYRTFDHPKVETSYRTPIPKNANVLPCVGRTQKSTFAQPTVPPPVTSLPLPVAQIEHLVWKRERDSERPASAFDSETGEYVEAPQKLNLQKGKARAYVADVLGRTGRRC
ncbi:plasmid recombination protein [Roseateles oligotrophus]|uniref:plasmid recombination protein n=1 Tax=Roseateles oligotrophus TaxID=1769250 RepID=UPI0032B12051